MSSTCIVLYYHKVTAQNKNRFEKQIDLILKFAKPIALQDEITLISGCHYVAVTFDDAFRSVMVNALPILVRRGIPATIFVSTGYLGARAGWINDKNDPDYKEILLSELDLRKIARDALFEFGSHCVSHSNLTHLPPYITWSELVDSKRELERILNRPVNLLSFPYGAFDETIIAMAQKAGYIRTFSTCPLPAFTYRGEFTTGRVKVDPDDYTIEFFLKMVGAYCWLGWLHSVMSRWKKRYVIRLKIGTR